MREGAPVSSSELAPAFTFDPVRHIYKCGDRIIPSVTQVLQSAGLINNAFGSELENEAAMERGTAVHLACQLDDENDLDESTLDPALNGYLEAWRRCKKEIGFRIDHIEKRSLHISRTYAGTVDRVVYFGPAAYDCGAIVDLKTGIIQPWTALQLAAYSELFAGVYRRIAVQLNDDGSYRMEEYPIAERRRDYGVFQGALAVHNWRLLNK